MPPRATREATGVFLSVYTPTYLRPQMLALCKESVEAQTEPTQHVIVEDHVGLGVGGMYADIPNHADRVEGIYVMVLSDDNTLADERVAEEMLAEVKRAMYPDVIVFKGSIEETIQPIVWNSEPTIEKIDLSCFAVRRGVWQRHATDWGHRYEGDFDFIHTLWRRGYRFHWWDRVAFKALRISRGLPE